MLFIICLIPKLWKIKYGEYFYETVLLVVVQIAPQALFIFSSLYLISEKNLTPEQFSEILVDDLEIPGAFVPVIANIIRTQVS